MKKIWLQNLEFLILSFDQLTWLKAERDADRSDMQRS